MSKDKSAYPTGAAPALGDPILPPIFPEEPELAMDPAVEVGDEIPAIGDDWVPPYDDTIQQ